MTFNKLVTWLQQLLLCAVVGASWCSLPGGQAYTPALTYYIQAEVVDWTYAPGGDRCTDIALMSSAKLAAVPEQHITVGWSPSAAQAWVFKKARYVQYTDATYMTQVVDPDQLHLGLLGPLLRAEAGTTIQIVLRNALSFGVNIEPVQGLMWTNTITEAVPTGGTGTYMWHIPSDAVTLPEALQTVASAQAAGVQTSRLVLYHSSVDAMSHDNAGLMGPIIVTAQGMANADGSSMGVSRDVVTAFMVADEQHSAMAADNDVSVLPVGKVYSINGRSWCNLDHLNVTLNEHVRWHVASISSDGVLHNVHWHGSVLMHEGHYKDAINLFGWQTASMDLIPDTAGSWLFHCHVHNHLERGMLAIYNALPGVALPVAQQQQQQGITRSYYLQAEEVQWDYTPYGKHMCASGKYGAVERSIDIISNGKCTKAIYVQYTDSSFTVRQRGASWPARQGTSEEYMGLLGPVLRADVGDIIQVVFRNNLRYAASVHPHGLFYDKAGEGSPYRDDSSQKLDDVVAPGDVYTYTWPVHARCGPGPASKGGTSVWMYHSHVNEPGETNAGLYGLIVIGTVNKQVTEKFIFLSATDELESIYAVENTQRHTAASAQAGASQLVDKSELQQASEHNNINGWAHCNNKLISFIAGRKYRLYIMAEDIQNDMYNPSVRGGAYGMLGLDRASVHAMAGQMNMLDVVFAQPLTAGREYVLSCVIHDLARTGMQLRYEVVSHSPGE